MKDEYSVSQEVDTLVNVAMVAALGAIVILSTVVGWLLWAY